METVTRVCDCCGSEFTDTIGRRGARRLYCSTECRKLVSALVEVDRHLQAVCSRLRNAPDLTDGQREAVSRLRGQAWAAANMTNMVGKPARIRTTPTRERAGWRGLHKPKDEDAEGRTA